MASKRFSRGRRSSPSRHYIDSDSNCYGMEHPVAEVIAVWSKAERVNCNRLINPARWHKVRQLSVEYGIAMLPKVLNPITATGLERNIQDGCLAYIEAGHMPTVTAMLQCMLFARYFHFPADVLAGMIEFGIVNPAVLQTYMDECLDEIVVCKRATG